MQTLSFDRPEFKQALRDYFYLIENHYPEKGSLKLVGDRYRLTRVERSLLYRGVTSRQQAVNIAKRLVTTPQQKIIIDGYNVLLTLLNYRLGHYVFISMDNLCRDAGSLFGKIRNEELFRECAASLSGYLIKRKTEKIILYLDSPVSQSRRHLKFLHKPIAEANIKVDIELVKSADQALLMHKSGTLATSDSAILFRFENPIIDIPRCILETKYKAKLFKLNMLLEL